MGARCVVEGLEDVKMKWKRFIDAVSEVQAHASVLQPITVELVASELLVLGVSWGANTVGSSMFPVDISARVNCNGGVHQIGRAHV